jgi:carboxy-terminal domain RNA polymerase II polypeptide A small phosphatase
MVKIQHSCEDRILLILDLDETLVHSSDRALETVPDFLLDEYFVYIRPGLKEFLCECNELYNIAIWTCSTEDYATEIIGHIFPKDIDPCFVFSRKRCNYRLNYEWGGYEVIKPLKKVKKKGFKLDRTLIVDNLQETF